MMTTVMLIIIIIMIIIIIIRIRIIDMRSMKAAMSSMENQSTHLLSLLYLLTSLKNHQLAVTDMTLVVQLVRMALLYGHMDFVKQDIKTEMVIVVKFVSKIFFYSTAIVCLYLHLCLYMHPYLCPADVLCVLSP